jgi:hypothetical protein
MSNNSNSDDILIRMTDERNRLRSDLTHRLYAQLTHNNSNPGQPLNYLNFPSDHPGHLDLERRTRLVSILRSSAMNNNYRFGSSLGIIYIKNTNRYPDTSPEMFVTV